MVETLKRTGVPGLSVAIVYKDQVVYLKGFGVRRAGKSEPVDPDTVFQLASMSKPIASTVVAALAGDGLVAWDDPIIRHDPSFAMHDAWVTRNVSLPAADCRTMTGDREIRRCGAVDDRRDDAGRQEGEGSEQADVPFALGLSRGRQAEIFAARPASLIAHGEPELTDRDPIVANLAPGPEIGASPGLANNPDAGMFDRHDILLVRTAQIEPHGAKRCPPRTTH